jgi:signal transduction histidine kinase
LGDIADALAQAPQPLNPLDYIRRNFQIPPEDGPACSAANSPAVSVAARDSGPGLDPEGLERLFDAFYATKPGGNYRRSRRPDFRGAN